MYVTCFEAPCAVSGQQGARARLGSESSESMGHAGWFWKGMSCQLRVKAEPSRKLLTIQADLRPN